MNSEPEFIKLYQISEIQKLPDNNALGSLNSESQDGYIYIPRIISKGYIISENIKTIDSIGYLVSITNDQYLSSFITLLLNSGAFRYEHLKATSPTVPLSVSLTNLKNFNIPVVDIILQSKLSHIGSQFFLYKKIQSSENDRYFEIKASFFRMLCDSMVFQLYHWDLLSENNIDLIGNIDILFPDNSYLDFEEMFKLLSSESNALMDNAKAFTHYFMTMSEKKKP